MHRTKTFTSADTLAVSSALSNGDITYVLEHKPGNLSYRPHEVFSVHQLTVSNLDSGTWGVRIWPPGQDSFKDLPTPIPSTGGSSKAETDTVVINKLAEKIEVVCVGGNNADPRVTLNSLPRMK